MGSNTTVEVTIEVLADFHVPQETMTGCGVESATTNTQSNDDAEAAVLEPRDDTTRRSKFTVWRVSGVCSSFHNNCSGVGAVCTTYSLLHSLSSDST